MTDNYALALEQARLYFLKQNQLKLLSRPGVRVDGSSFCLTFLGADARVDRGTGVVSCRLLDGSWEPAGFAQALSIYDWLCDQKEAAKAAGEYCPVHSLPGVYVRGSGLAMTGGKLTPLFDREPQKLRSACEAMGGEAVELGDVGYKLPVFPGLYVLLKFYHSDDDFPAVLTLLWDRNILDFIRYETVYYVAGCLMHRLATLCGPQDIA